MLPDSFFYGNSSLQIVPDLQSAAFQHTSSNYYMKEKMEIVPSYTIAKPVLLSPRCLKRVEEAMTYVRKNYQSHLSAEQLSLEVKLSVSKLQSGLKLLTGCTLYKYHEMVRVCAAKKLLEDSQNSISIIARKTGFKTHSHFGEVFKRITGMTPSEYRNHYGC